MNILKLPIAELTLSLFHIYSNMNFKNVPPEKVKLWRCDKVPASFIVVFILLARAATLALRRQVIAKVKVFNF